MLNPSEQEELERLWGVLGTFPEGTEIRTAQRIARELLLDGWVFWNGARCMLYAKPVGAGVYALTVTKIR